MSLTGGRVRSFGGEKSASPTEEAFGVLEERNKRSQ